MPVADWLFTVPSGIVQPATGIALILLGGFDPFSPWLVLVYLLYLVALACWLPVMTLQYRVARLAGGAAASAVLLPPEYHRAMRQPHVESAAEPPCRTAAWRSAHAAA